MKRRDFIAGVASLAAMVGLGSSAVVQETFLEKLKRLGCDVIKSPAVLTPRGTIEYQVAIVGKGFWCSSWGMTREDCLSQLEESFDRIWSKYGPKPLDAFAVYG